MNATISTERRVSGSSTLINRMLNIVTSPAEVLDEVCSSPVDLANWRGPTLLVCLTALLGLQVRLATEFVGGARPLAGYLVTIGFTLAGSLWSAFSLWFIGRVFLRAPVGYLKALEVAGLASCVVALGQVITALLVFAVGNAGTQPSLTFLADNLAVGPAPRQLLALVNPFHLWSIGILSLGLGRLAGVSTKEAAFWAFGYWFILRIVLNLIVSR